MPRITRDAKVTWEGSSAKGRGAITAATSGAFAGIPYSEPSRIAATEASETSPEELLAAAHAACYAMSLAAELTRDRTPPERLDVRATVVMDEVEGEGHRVVASQLLVRARVRGSDDAAFAEATRRADAGCPFSALVRASAEVSIDATLEVS
ncbi:MAG: OsmC family peroxiredoxin [Pseudomonadota bacterium]